MKPTVVKIGPSLGPLLQRSLSPTARQPLLATVRWELWFDICGENACPTTAQHASDGGRSRHSARPSIAVLMVGERAPHEARDDCPRPVGEML
jgi:hypothetical protein